MEGPPLGPGGEDITWPDQVAPRGRKASSTRKIKPQTSNLLCSYCSMSHSWEHGLQQCVDADIDFVVREFVKEHQNVVVHTICRRHA